MNDLYYGNLNKSFLPYLDVKNEFTQYFDEFAMIPFPNFYESLQENEFIMSVQEKAEQSAEWDKVKNFCFLWDAELIESLKTSLSKLGIPHDDSYIDYLTTITEDLGALIMQLKNHYQRARPYQYAFYGNQKLHPYDTFSGITPSYPSGHATQTYFLCKVIATHYEEKAKELDALAKRVADSRVIMGVHFPSDNEFGINIAQALLEKQDIIAKYLE